MGANKTHHSHIMWLFLWKSKLIFKGELVVGRLLLLLLIPIWITHVALLFFQNPIWGSKNKEVLTPTRLVKSYENDGLANYALFSITWKIVTYVKDKTHPVFNTRYVSSVSEHQHFEKMSSVFKWHARVVPRRCNWHSCGECRRRHLCAYTVPLLRPLLRC